MVPAICGTPFVLLSSPGGCTVMHVVSVGGAYCNAPIKVMPTTPKSEYGGDFTN